MREELFSVHSSQFTVHSKQNQEQYSVLSVNREPIIVNGSSKWFSIR